MSARALDALDLQINDRDNAVTPLFGEEMLLATATVSADEVELDPELLDYDPFF